MLPKALDHVQVMLILCFKIWFSLLMLTSLIGL